MKFQEEWQAMPRFNKAVKRPRIVKRGKRRVVEPTVRPENLPKIDFVKEIERSREEHLQYLMRSVLKKCKAK